MHKRHVWLVWSVLLATPVFLDANQDQAAQAAGKRDSVFTLRNAENAVSTYLYRLAMNRQILEIPKLPWPFICENRVDNYCFGPTNGGVPFGASNVVHAVEFSTSPLFVPRIGRRQIDGFFRYMMNELDRFQKKIPGDSWIIGQRVYHLVDHGEIERAQRVAHDCRSEKWWCAALVAYTSYHLNQFQRADSAVTVSMNSAPYVERCLFEDVSPLLYGDPDRSWYTKLSCAERKELAPTIWWLSDPLFLTPGNERLAAHLYREISGRMFLLMSNAQPPLQPLRIRRVPSKLDFGDLQPMPTENDRKMWQSGALQSLLRSLGVPSFRAGNEGDILFQYKQPTYHFVPTIAAIRDPLNATASSWNIEDPDAQERYHPQFGAFTTLTHQIAWFRRESRAQIVAAIDVAGNPLLGGATRRQLYSTALFLSRSPSDVRAFRDTIPGKRSTFFSRVPAESAIVSLEAMVSGVGAGRVRLASGPPVMPAQRVVVSDMLMLDRMESPPSTLDSAARHARPNTSVPRGSPLGLFWEMYGLAVGDTVSYQLSAAETERSTLTNIGRFMGLVGGERGSAVQWTEVVSSAAPVEGRNIALDLSTLPIGKYVLQLEVRVPGQQPVLARRHFEVVRPASDTTGGPG